MHTICAKVVMDVQLFLCADSVVKQAWVVKEAMKRCRGAYGRSSDAGNTDRVA